MAELLIKAKPHWMDNFMQTEVDKMTLEEKQSYEARSQIGDIIVVRPDGWQWGKEECLPNFVVIQVPDMTLEEAKIYEESLYEEIIATEEKSPKMLKVRKYNVEKAIIDLAKTEDKSKIVKEKLVIKPKIIKKDK